MKTAYETRAFDWDAVELGFYDYDYVHIYKYVLMSSNVYRGEKQLFFNWNHQARLCRMSICRVCKLCK